MPQRYYVPAAAGQIAYLIMVQALEGARPTMADVFVDTYNVVAWRITAFGLGPEGDGVECEEFIYPVLIDDPTSEQEIMHLLPDGRICWPLTEIFADLEAAKAGMLERAQAAWDRDHSSAQAAKLA